MMNERKFGYMQKFPACTSPSGCRKKPGYQLKQTGNNYELVKVGEIDIQAQIASYEDAVSLPKMIERFKRGDDTALTRSHGFYADVSGFEDNPAAVIDNTRKLVSALADKAPSDAAPSDAAPSDAAPSDAAPSDAAPSDKKGE